MLSLYLPGGTYASSVVGIFIDGRRINIWSCCEWNYAWSILFNVISFTNDNDFICFVFSKYIDVRELTKIFIDNIMGELHIDVLDISLYFLAVIKLSRFAYLSKKRYLSALFSSDSRTTMFVYLSLATKIIARFFMKVLVFNFT